MRAGQTESRLQSLESSGVARTMSHHDHARRTFHMVSFRTVPLLCRSWSPSEDPTP
jgi:hypothetical protein